MGVFVLFPSHSDLHFWAFFEKFVFIWVFFKCPLALNMTALRLAADDSKGVCSSKGFWLEFVNEVFSNLWKEPVCFVRYPVLFISWCFLYSKGNILSSLWLEAFWPLQLYLLTWCTLYWELFLSLVFDGRSNGGSSLLRPLLPTLSPPESVVSYEDDFASSPGSSTLTDKKLARDLR